jgi:hypothetical protein
MNNVIVSPVTNVAPPPKIDIPTPPPPAPIENPIDPLQSTTKEPSYYDTLSKNSSSPVSTQESPSTTADPLSNLPTSIPSEVVQDQ